MDLGTGPSHINTEAVISKTWKLHS